jgi:enoyl-CoA hydratase/carnithine racemase
MTSLLAKGPVYFPLGSDKQLLRVTDKDSYYLLEYNSPPDNRYTVEFIDSYLETLVFLRTKCEPKALVTTSTIPKFFSNGLDFERVIKVERFFPDRYYALMRAILEFPWPTIALVNGHAFAAGFMVAAVHDYRVMNPTKGFLCMNEIDFGAPLFTLFVDIFKIKFGAQIALKICLQAHRFTGKEALQVGLVDALGDLSTAEEFVTNQCKYANSPVYASIRKNILRDLITDSHRHEEDSEALDILAAKEEQWVSNIEKKIDAKLAKAKL